MFLVSELLSVRFLLLPDLSNFLEPGLVVTASVKFSLIVEVPIVNPGSKLDYSLEYLRPIKFVNFVNNVLLKPVVEEYNEYLFPNIGFSRLDSKCNSVVCN